MNNNPFFERYEPEFNLFNQCGLKVDNELFPLVYAYKWGLLYEPKLSPEGMETNLKRILETHGQEAVDNFIMFAVIEYLCISSQESFIKAMELPRFSKYVNQILDYVELFATLKTQTLKGYLN